MWFDTAYLSNSSLTDSKKDNLWDEKYERKKVLKFGSGVGTFTMHLADGVGSEGETIATDLSKKPLLCSLTEGKRSEFLDCR